MARVILEPLGSPLDRFLAARDADRNRAAMNAAAAPVLKAREEVRDGWGPEYRERVHKKGKLTAWERIDLLADPGTPVLPIQSFVNHGVEFEGGKTSPGAGAVTAFVKIHGRFTMVIANDNTVASGAWWPRTPEKIERAQAIALRLRLPVIYLVDCSGLFLPEQARSFPGPRGAGHIFKMNSLLSAAGVPQIAGVFGDCIAGGGYMPIISDVVYMTEQAYMVIAGAALIKGGKAQHVTSLDIGGPDVHVHLSRCADHRVPDDASLLALVRRDVALLPSSAAGYYRYGADPAPPLHPPEELSAILPSDHRMPYDVRQVIARLVDHSLFREYFADRGEELVTGVGRIGGLYAGIIANQQLLLDHPDRPGTKRPGGILYRDGIAKIALFSRALNDDGIPIVWLQDVSGFDIGAEAEKEGLLGYGSSLIYTNSTNETPMITVLLRKASGAGYYAMAGAPYDPVLQLATPITRLAVMEGRTLAIGAFRTKLDDDFEIETKDPAERTKVEEGMKKVEARITADMNPLRAASQMDVDEIAPLGELRTWLEASVEMTYQATGHRRVKNPRIWGLHDVAALTERR